MAPYFKGAVLFYLLSTVVLFLLESSFDLGALSTLAWVHMSLIGFMMLIIFAAMAQLSAVFSETKHVYVDYLRLVWFFIMLGLLLMMVGFFSHIFFLLLGGLLILVAFGIYVFDLVLTLKNRSRRTSITLSMLSSNAFLLFGVLSGIMMALNFNGILSINELLWKKLHIISLLFGYVLVTIMGVSTVLIPMFGVTKRVSDREFSLTFYSMSSGVLISILGTFLQIGMLKYLAYTLILFSICIYLFHVFKMLQHRRIKEYDIWIKHIYISFSTLSLSVITAVLYALTQELLFLKLTTWLFLGGFLSFLLIGHLYKIVPFLAFFEYYSEFIGEHDVPMLHEMLPERAANMQFIFTTLGFLSVLFAIGINSDVLFEAGSSFLIVGALFLVLNVFKMLYNHSTI